MSEIVSFLKYGDKELEAFVALSNNAHFLHLIDYWARHSEALAVSSTIVADETAMRWKQGRSQECAEIAKTFKDARITLDAIKRNK